MVQKKAVIAFLRTLLCYVEGRQRRGRDVISAEAYMRLNAVYFRLKYKS